MTPRGIDYYVVLQVHPDAEREVIDAAYRQLMRKYHPDVAGTDPIQAARLNERAKLINQAYAVLRDPLQRDIYDRMRLGGGTRVSAPPRPPGPPPGSVASAWQAATQPTVEADPASMPVELAEPGWLSALRAPWVAISSAYFLLPGAYEWDRNSRREVTQAFVIPPLGIASWLIATGRLDGLLGASVFAALGLWATIGLIALVTLGSAVPRLAVAGGGTLLLLAGTFDTHIRAAGVPIWMAWVGLSLLSVILAARVYVFGVLPTVGICWLLARLT